VLADGLVSLASLAGRTVVVAAVTDVRGMTKDVRGMTKRGSARLTGRGDAGRTELAGRLLASQRKFAGDVLRATTPLLPGKGGTGAKKSGGEARQASPSRRAGPATCDRSTARGEPIAVRRGLAYHLAQRAQGTELRSDSDRYLERADAMPGRLHPQSA
jgi:hypothetical protein